MKTIEIVEAYKILSQAKYQKMSDDGKIKVWKITRQLRPIALQFEEEQNDAKEKLIPSEDFMQKLQKAQQYELSLKNKDIIPNISKEEYEKFIQEFIKYNNIINDALKEISEKEVNLIFEKISEEEFGKLMASNDWNMDQVNKIEFIVK